MDIARLAMAQAAGRGKGCGYCLAGAGRTAFEKSIGFRATLGNRLQSGLRQLGIAGYVASIFFCTAVFLGIALRLLTGEAGDGGWLALLGLLLAVPVMCAKQ